jgi:hypothetical protein
MDAFKRWCHIWHWPTGSRSNWLFMHISLEIISLANKYVLDTYKNLICRISWCQILPWVTGSRSNRLKYFYLEKYSLYSLYVYCTYIGSHVDAFKRWYLIWPWPTGSRSNWLYIMHISLEMISLANRYVLDTCKKSYCRISRCQIWSWATESRSNRLYIIISQIFFTLELMYILYAYRKPYMSSFDSWCEIWP